MRNIDEAELTRKLGLGFILRSIVGSGPDSVSI